MESSIVHHHTTVEKKLCWGIYRKNVAMDESYHHIYALHLISVHAFIVQLVNNS